MSQYPLRYSPSECREQISRHLAEIEYYKSLKPSDYRDLMIAAEQNELRIWESYLEEAENERQQKSHYS